MNNVIRAAMTATIALAFGVAAPAAMAQAKDAKPQSGEKTVEEAYLQESAEIMMVKEFSHAADKDSKLLALFYAKRALDGGRKNEDIRNSLQYLALEGNQVLIRSAGRGAVTNNFPDIKAKACEYLGEFPSVESKNTLVNVLSNNKIEDPMVLAEAVRSLGKIGMNANDEVVHAIAAAAGHFSNMGVSEDRFAIYTLFALNDLAEKNNGIKDMESATNIILNFTRGTYAGTVKNLAMQTLDKLSQYSVMNSGK
jgi:hypothetical protein